MSILSFFTSDMVTVTIKRDAVTVGNGIVARAPATVGSVDCLYWEGSAATSFVGERFRDVTAAAIAVPIGTDIRKGDIIAANGKEYRALDPDNVGAADEYLLVALEVFG